MDGDRRRHAALATATTWPSRDADGPGRRQVPADALNGRIDVWSRSLPWAGSPVDRLVARCVSALALRRIVAVDGIEHIMPSRDPFILACNHSTRADAVLLPTLLMLLRGGKRIHFVADWPPMLIPGVGLIYRSGQVIVVGRKSARPRFLNVLRPLLVGEGDPHDRALARLREGAPVGLFPEGTMNRDPRRLLRGRLGAAALAVSSGVPVVPMGVRFPDHDGRSPIPDSAPMKVTIGPPVEVEPGATVRSRDEIRRIHSLVMNRISDLSGKSWTSRGGPRCT